MSAQEASKPTGWSGHQNFTMDDLAAMQPGLARIMPEIGTRYWKLYYAAKENNWTLAHFQLKEIKELMEFGMVTRPKYEEHLDTFIRDDLGAIEKAIKAQDWNAVEAAFQQGITNANDYHQLNDKGFIVWKLPDYLPPDLDLTPQD